MLMPERGARGCACEFGVRAGGRTSVAEKSRCEFVLAFRCVAGSSA